MLNFSKRTNCLSENNNNNNNNYYYYYYYYYYKSVEILELCAISIKCITFCLCLS